MSTWATKAGDTAPIRFELQQEGLNLANASSVAFHYIKVKDDLGRPVSGEVAVVRAATVFDAVENLVQYAWMAGETDVVGTYEFEWEVTFLDASVLTWPGDGRGTMVIAPAIA